MPCGVTANLIEVLGDGSVRVTGVSDTTQCQSFTIAVLNLTVNKAATLDTQGDWETVFSGAEITGDLARFRRDVCGKFFKYIVTCTDPDLDCSGSDPVPVSCDGCPSVSVTVDSGACNDDDTMRTMTFQVTVGGGAQIQYMWNFGDGSALTPQATGSDSFQQSYDYATDDTYFANLIVVVPPGCTATPDPITVIVDPCASTACPDNPRFIAERHMPRGQRERVDLEAQCVPAGDYTLSLSNSYPAGTQLTWYVSDNVAGQGVSIELSVSEGETVEVEVIAIKDGCPPVSESVDLSGCTDCSTENELVLERRLPDGRREHVPVDEGCVPAGNYVVRLLEPEGNFAIDWFENGVLAPGQHGRTLRIRLEEGEQLTVSATVVIPGCDNLNPSITIEACECPDDLSLTVFDEAGDEIDPSQCVVPGTYIVQARASGLRDESTERTWQINGRDVASDGTELDVRVEAPVTASCFGGSPRTSVSFTAATPGCTLRTTTVVLTPCAEYVFSICCQLLGTVVLLLAGLTTVAAALAFCPQVLIVPPLVAFFIAFGFWIFLALLVLLVIAVIIWLVICKLDWCRDILPKLWQIALIAGIVFIYFGSCPLCTATLIGSLFVWGVILLLLGASLLLFWILSCRPTQCLTVWRLIELGVVNTIISAIESILGFLPAVFGMTACISIGALVFLWLITLTLDVLVLLLPLFCSFNPAAPAAIAFFRRPQPFTGTGRLKYRKLLASTDRSIVTNVQAVSVQRVASTTAPRSGCGCGGKSSRRPD